MNRFDLNLDIAGAAAERYFTPDEANRSLVLVKRIVEDIITRYHRLVDLQELIDTAQRTGAHAQCDLAQQELVRVAEKIQSCAEELDELGVELRDWAMGIVDFPCLAGGREVYLSWRLGEASVGHWHETDASSQDVLPIDTLPEEQLVANCESRIAD